MRKKSPLYTRGGDAGETGLFGGMRIPKSAVRLHAYGTVDELNAALGVVAASAELPDAIRGQLRRVQSVLFLVGADLATPMDASTHIPRVEETHIRELEEWIDAWDGSLPALKSFVLPGGSADGAALHLARTVARRAERWTADLASHEHLNTHMLPYLNRLGDYLFVAARAVTHTLKGEETPVSVRQEFSGETRN